mmetsp:Transcript_12581/g.31693  ORF Transcript_12581/g.31693 Transcript_12581/m.31693 type:complete len:213 (+) Transcript_12581:1113-1751(+)
MVARQFEESFGYFYVEINVLLVNIRLRCHSRCHPWCHSRRHAWLGNGCRSSAHHGCRWCRAHASRGRRRRLESTRCRSLKLTGCRRCPWGSKGTGSGRWRGCSSSTWWRRTLEPHVCHSLIQLLDATVARRRGSESSAAASRRRRSSKPTTRGWRRKTSTARWRRCKASSATRGWRRRCPELVVVRGRRRRGWKTHDLVGGEAFFFFLVGLP